jgi:hypothetical protein
MDCGGAGRRRGGLSVLLGGMIGSGLLGGLVNYLLARKEDAESASFWHSATLRIAAATLVPLFLNMISSDLLESIRNGGASPDVHKFLVFVGFCLIGAISSTTFIKALPDRVLQEAKHAKKVALQADHKASQAQAEIRPILEKETEDEETLDSALPVAETLSQLTENERKVLAEPCGRKVGTASTNQHPHSNRNPQCRSCGTDFNKESRRFGIRTRKKEIPDHSGQPCGRVEQAASAQARKSQPIKKSIRRPVVPGYTSTHVSNAIIRCVPVVR